MSKRWDPDFERRREIRKHVRDQIRNGLSGQRWPAAGTASVHLVIGIAVVILGALALISNLHIIEIRSPMRYMGSAILLAIGFALVLNHRTERTWRWGIGWILAGIWSFAYTSGWIDVNLWSLFWPVFFLAVGAYLVRRSLSEDESPPEGAAGPNGDPNTPSGPDSGSQPSVAPRMGERTIRGIGVLSGSELKPGSQSMNRAELFALMGGVKLDLYDAQLINDAATINVAACMGGIEILVPSEWTVVSNVLPLMGAFIDKRRPAAATTLTTAPKKTLTVNGFVLMGGIEIKN